MQIVRIENYIRKTDWGINVYTKENRKIKVSQKTVESFLSENLTKLSNRNIEFLRNLSFKNIPTEIQ